MAGSIKVDSEVNKGSTFSMEVELNDMRDLLLETSQLHCNDDSVSVPNDDEDCYLKATQMTFRLNPFSEEFRNIQMKYTCTDFKLKKSPSWKELFDKRETKHKSVKGSNEYDNGICKSCMDVLIVDDNSFNVLALDMLLQDMPHMLNRRIDKVSNT